MGDLVFLLKLQKKVMGRISHKKDKPSLFITPAGSGSMDKKARNSILAETEENISSLHLALGRSSSVAPLRCPFMPKQDPRCVKKKKDQTRNTNAGGAQSPRGWARPMRSCYVFDFFFFL